MRHTKSLYCTPKTNIILLINYISIKKLNKKKDWLRIIASYLGSLWPHCTYAGPHPVPRDPLKCRSDLINPPGTFRYTLNTSKGFSFWRFLHTGFLLLFLTLLTSAPASRPVHFPLPWTPSSLLHTLFLTTLSPRISRPLFREMGSENTIDSCPYSPPRPITVCPLLCSIFLLFPDILLSWKS